MRSKQESSPVRGIIRQGDVLLVPVEGLPGAQARAGRRRPAHRPRRRARRPGTRTSCRGRARLVHSTTAPSWRGVGRTHLVVEEPAALVHDEHDAIELAARHLRGAPAARVHAARPARPQGFRWVAD